MVGILFVVLVTAFVIVRIVQTSGPGPDPGPLVASGPGPSIDDAGTLVATRSGRPARVRVPVRIGPSLRSAARRGRLNPPEGCLTKGEAV